MEHGVLLGLTTVVLLGTLAQWLGWRLQIPSILLLLTFGLVAGPGLGWLDPDALFGDLVFPAASIAVAVILFEGGLTLKLKEFRESGALILRLISIGSLLSLGLTAFFAAWFLRFPLEVALLLGALLVITGPTVIGPMLRQIRPRGRISHIVKWEGILNDPVGAILAVILLEAILHGGLPNLPVFLATGAVLTLVVSLLGAAVVGLLLVGAMRVRWLPDYLHIPVTLTAVIGLYSAANLVQEEAGLVAVTLLGIFLANQRSFPVRHIVEFKENLQILLISALFIVLGARVTPDTLQQVGWQSFFFLVAMIVVVRPASVLLSTLGSGLDWKERVFLILMAPRGIVVTALASVFAFRLTEMGSPYGERFFAEVLFVILGTVLFYGIAASLFARRVQIGIANPEGVLLVGAHPWARTIGLALLGRGVAVQLIDGNRDFVEQARREGLEAHHGNIYSSEFIEDIDLSEIGRALAVTPNTELNAYAELELGNYLGKTRVYHLAGEEDSKELRGGSTQRQKNVLFDAQATFDRLEEEFYTGATVREFVLEGDREWSVRDLEALMPSAACFLPLFAITPGGEVQVFSSRSRTELRRGTCVLALAREEDGHALPSGRQQQWERLLEPNRPENERRGRKERRTTV